MEVVSYAAKIVALQALPRWECLQREVEQTIPGFFPMAGRPSCSQPVASAQKTLLRPRGGNVDDIGPKKNWKEGLIEHLP